MSDAPEEALDNVDANVDKGGVDECGGREVDDTQQVPATGMSQAERDGVFSSTLRDKLLPCTKSKVEEETDTEAASPPDLKFQTSDLPTLPRVSCHSDVYDTSHKEMGHALIINQEQFSPQLRSQGYSRRTGTGIDERSIHRRLKHLGFQVTSYPDLTANQMRNVCAKIANYDHSNCSSFVCVILSHGEEGIVFGTDKAVHIRELSDKFKGEACPSLIGKPKVFIIQACRGHQTDPGVDVKVTQDETDGPVTVPLSVKLPVEADFLFAYSTVPGYYSWRNGANGSWFIQALCDLLETTSDPIEIRKLLTKVHKKVAQNYRSWNPENTDFHKMKQVPCMASMLTKDLILARRKKRH